MRYAGAMDREWLLALAGKYRAIARLRLDKQRTGRTAPREDLSALAGQFPGALRELEALPSAIVEQRITALERAAEGAAPGEPWMIWMHRYHTLLRAALRLKLAVKRRSPLPEATAASLAEQATRLAGMTVRPALVQAIARPPGGRIADAVLEAIAEEEGVSIEALREAVLPPKLGH
jgi:hypothetical protein